MAKRGTGRCSQQTFTTAGLRRVTGIGPDQIGRILPLCIQRKTTPGQDINVEVALRATTLGLCSELGVDLEDVACAQGPLINSALTLMVMTPGYWQIVGEEGEPTSFRDVFPEAPGKGLELRHFQGLLGIQECRMHRFLVRRPGEKWSVADDTPERIRSGQDPFIMVLDALAVMRKLTKAAEGPFFFWEAN